MSMTASVIALWEKLSAGSLLWFAMTLLIYLGGSWLYRRTNAFALFHPVLVAMVMLVAVLKLTGTPYSTYFAGTSFLHFLLGPATVALAVPLARATQRIEQLLIPILITLFVGSITAIVSAWGIAYALGASSPTLISFLPKSVTTPIAMGIAEKIGGEPAIAAIFVIVTGVFGAAVGQNVLDICRIREPAARGFAMGLAAHGVGTARAFQMHEESGAFSGLAMGLNGVLTAILVPLLMYLIWP